MAPTRSTQDRSTARAALSTVSDNAGNHHQTRKRTASAAPRGRSTSASTGKKKQGKAPRTARSVDYSPDIAEAGSAHPSPSPSDADSSTPESAQLRRILGVGNKAVGNNGTDTESEPPSPDLLARAPPAVRGKGKGSTRGPARVSTTAPAGRGSRPQQGSRERPLLSDEAASSTAPRGRAVTSRGGSASSAPKRSSVPERGSSTDEAASSTAPRGRAVTSRGGSASSAPRRSSVPERGSSAVGPRLLSLRDIERSRSSKARPATSGSGRRLSQGIPVPTRRASVQDAGGAAGPASSDGGGASSRETSSGARPSRPAPTSSSSGSSNGARASSFGRIGAASRQESDRSRVSGGGESRAIINSTMSGEELHKMLGVAKCPPIAVAALLGVLLHAVAPHLVAVKKEDTTSTTVKGERTAHGVVSHIFTPWSYAFIGDGKNEFSHGIPGTEKNHPFFAAAFHVWPGAKNNPNWQADFASSLGPSRSTFHSATREAVRDAMITIIDMEDADNTHSTCSELFRGARERLIDMAANSEVFLVLMGRMFSKCMDSHRRSAGEHVTIAGVFGAKDIMKYFTSEVATPVILHALTDAEHSLVPRTGEESPHCLATRKARSFSGLVNGGFRSNQARAFQNILWRHVFDFVSSKRRTGYGLRTIPMSKLASSDIVRYIAPYAVNAGTALEASDMDYEDVRAEADDMDGEADNMDGEADNMEREADNMDGEVFDMNDEPLDMDGGTAGMYIEETAARRNRGEDRIIDGNAELQTYLQTEHE